MNGSDSARSSPVEPAFWAVIDLRGLRRSQVHPQPKRYREQVNPVDPRGVHDEAKRYGEALTSAYRCYRQVDTGIVRIFNTYGPLPRTGR